MNYSKCRSAFNGSNGNEVSILFKQIAALRCATFVYKGNMASYFMNAKKHVSLMFHKGAFIKDKNGLLEGDGKEGRVAKFSSVEEIEKRRRDLEAAVKEWIKMQDKT